MNSFPRGDLAVVIGSAGGIGSACVRALAGCGSFAATVGLGRTSSPPLDLADEASIVGCAEAVARLGKPRLILVATGVLHSERMQPEKSLRELDPAVLAEAFA
ncbi:MAG: C-factor, partial [Proteobacteria bacterium]|nr:C-factor [Pseudomonadota bacterium]